MKSLPWPDYDIPPQDALIWRYLTTAKFIALLQDGLFVPSIGTLRSLDPFEGRCTGPEIEHLQQATRDGNFVQDLVSLTEDMTTRKTYVSAWCLGEDENGSMWKSFVGGGADAGVAICTTVGALADALRPIDSAVAIGRVRYEYDARSAGHVPGSVLHFRKRRLLAHESEVRAVFFHPRMSSEGVTVPLDLKAVIREIRTCPGSQPWFRHLIRRLADSAGMNGVPVLRSVADATPVTFPG